jgi:hypothetical protein
MSAKYKLYGELGLRKCPEAVAIIKKLRSFLGSCDGLEVGECEPGLLSLSLDIYDSFPGGSVLELDGLVKSLGPFTLEPTALVSVYDDDEDVLVVAATEGQEVETLSRHRLHQISELMPDLLPEDRRCLATMAANGTA